jgi:hypothetical protein
VSDADISVIFQWSVFNWHSDLNLTRRTALFAEYVQFTGILFLEVYTYIKCGLICWPSDCVF